MTNAFVPDISPTEMASAVIDVEMLLTRNPIQLSHCTSAKNSNFLARPEGRLIVDNILNGDLADAHTLTVLIPAPDGMDSIITSVKMDPELHFDKAVLDRYRDKIDKAARHCKFTQSFDSDTDLQHIAEYASALLAIALIQYLTGIEHNDSVKIAMGRDLISYMFGIYKSCGCLIFPIDRNTTTGAPIDPETYIEFVSFIGPTLN